MTPSSPDPLPVGAVFASALMAANIPCDSGEDVDRLIAEMWTRGLRVVSALPAPPDHRLREALREAIGHQAADGDGLPHWHHASGGTDVRAEDNERDGVFVDRQQVLDAIDRVLG